MNFDRLEVIATELNLATNDLSADVIRIEKKLNSLNLGVQCFIDTEKNVQLGYSRFNKKWGFIVRLGNEQWRLLESPKELRILAIMYIPDLCEQMIDATKATMVRIKKSVDTAKEIIKVIEKVG